jgi:hypothetical protein
MKLEEFVEQFAENVAAQPDAIWRGDARMGNKHAACLLLHRIEEAKAVLEETSKGKGLVPLRSKP